MGRSHGLMGSDSIFDLEPGDPGLITSLCVILCFLPLRINFVILSKGGPLIEYQLYGANNGTF